MKQGRWKKGESGNPRGRPPGSGQIAELRQAIFAQVPAILARLTEAAIDGDVGAARLILERVLPPLRTAEEPMAPLALDGKSPSEQGRAVVAAAASGALNTAQAGAMMSAIAALTKITEADELLRRVEALEGRQGGMKA